MTNTCIHNFDHLSKMGWTFTLYMHTVHTYRLWEHAHCARSWSVNYFPGRNCSGLHVSDHYKIAAIDPQYEFTGQGAECYVFQQDVSNDTSTGQTTKEAPESVEGMDFDFSAKKKKKKKKKVCTCTVCRLSLSDQPPPPPPPCEHVTGIWVFITK